MMRAESAAKRTLEREQKVRLAGEAVADGAPAQPEGAAALPRTAEPQPRRRTCAAAALPSAAEPPVQPPRVAAVRPTAAPPSAAGHRPSRRLAGRRPGPAVPHVRPGSAPPPSAEAIAKAEDFATMHARPRRGSATTAASRHRARRISAA